MNLLEIIESDGHKLKKTSSMKNGTYKGPCPICGGEDRFSVYPDYQGGSYICNQCGKRGDTLQYLIDFRNLRYHDACLQLGRQPEIKHKKLSAAIKPLNSSTEISKKIEKPEQKWSDKLSMLAFEHFKFLMSGNGKKHRDYLNKRGLTNETIKTARLGFNNQSSTFDRSSFGLSQEINEKTGKPKNLWIPEGITIPFFDEQGVLNRVRVRQENPDPRFGKYIVIPGSSSSYFIYPGFDPKKPTAVVEAELDGWLIWQECSDIINIMAIGNDSNKPDIHVDDLLKQSSHILMCSDFDVAGINSGDWWVKTYNAIVHLTPFCKDPSEAFFEGLNIRNWIKAGIELNFKQNIDIKIEIEPEFEFNEKTVIEIEHDNFAEDAEQVFLDEQMDKILNNETYREYCLHNKWCGHLKHNKCMLNDENIFDIEECVYKDEPRWIKWDNGWGIVEIISMPVSKNRN